MWFSIPASEIPRPCAVGLTQDGSTSKTLRQDPETSARDVKSWSVVGLLILWLAYVACVESLARMIQHESSRTSGPRAVPKGIQEKIDACAAKDSWIPPLARWDSFWFYDVAAQGYTGTDLSKGSWPVDTMQVRLRPFALPLYPCTMRWLARAFSTDLFTAGLWISRLSLLATLAALSWSQGTAEQNKGPWAAAMALLCFPAAFILVSVYSESLFLACVMACLGSVKRRWYAPAAVTACAACLTRINGVALMPALLIWAWEERRRGTKDWASFLPPAGAALGIIAVGLYFADALGDPFAYFTSKREAWRVHFTPPWTTLERAVDRCLAAAAAHDLSSLYVYLELPCLALVAAAIAILFIRRSWMEGTFVSASALMVLVSGSLWGMPRFTIILYPVFLTLADLRRHCAVLWCACMLFGALAQGLLLYVYVTFGVPAP